MKGCDGMVATSVDHDAAKKALAEAWKAIGDVSIVSPAKIVPYLEAVIEAPDVTFKYLLVTGLLAKYVEPGIHPRVIQVASELEMSYDARSLCHDVVVGFEKTKGDLWGLSNEPYLNKPARHPEHDKYNTQIRNKRLATTLHDALEFANTAPRKTVFAMLVHVLRLSKERMELNPVATTEVESSYRRVVSFVQKFLEETDGGSRLVAVVGAYLTLMNAGFKVNVWPPNYSDKFAKTAGDVEIMHEQNVVSAYESKQRPLTLDDVKHGIKKAKEGGMLEYCFVYSDGLAVRLSNRFALVR
jgi:hypothetical protein